MGKIIGGIFTTLAIFGLALFLLFYFDVLSFGKGSGEGNSTVKTETSADKYSEAADEPEEIAVTIMVKQDQYLIDEREVTLTQIKEKVADNSATVKVILEDNYASAKAWDDIKTSLTGWGITPIEQ